MNNIKLLLTHLGICFINFDNDRMEIDEIKITITWKFFISKTLPNMYIKSKKPGSYAKYSLEMPELLINS